MFVNLLPFDVSLSSPRETSIFSGNKSCSFLRVLSLNVNYGLNNLQSFKATESVKGVTINIFDCVAMEKPANNDADGVTA